MKTFENGGEKGKGLRSPGCKERYRRESRKSGGAKKRIKLNCDQRGWEKSQRTERIK